MTCLVAIKFFCYFNIIIVAHVKDDIILLVSSLCMLITNNKDNNL